MTFQPSSRPVLLAKLVTAVGRTAWQRVERRSFPGAAEGLLDPFRADEAPSSAAYDDLIRYFAQGWVTYRSPCGSRIWYPGWPSWSGADVDGIEGFARLMPMFAAWCASGRQADVDLPTGAQISIPDEFTRALVTGTDPTSASYWGAMPGKSNQRIAEAADIALSLWLLRDTVWTDLSDSQRTAVVEWLAQAGDAPGLDKNWHLFFVLIDRVLAALGHRGAVPDARNRFERIVSFHLGDGWFEDGPGGKVDYYSAWGFHYPLSWINRIDPDWAPDVIADVQRAFLRTYPLLIAASGLPILGRSVSYRLAAPAPLVFGQQDHPELVSPARARRALDAVWTHFVRAGAVTRGHVTQGYHGPDARITDNYSGPASPLWSLRSLVAAFSLPPESPFWTTPPGLLPVERTSYVADVAGGRWRVHGDESNRTVRVEVLENSRGAAPPLEPYRIKQRLRDLAEGQPRRPGNEEAKYGARFYASDDPFCA